MGIFDFFSKKRREQRRKLKELQQLSGVFSTLDRLEQGGQLVWDMKQRRLFISQSLAVLMMRSAESWTAFVENTYQWLYYQQAQQAWNDHFLREELAAVRRASTGDNHQQVQLSRQDVERIRLAAREQVAESDMEPQKVEPFELFVVEDTVDTKPRIIAVGYFDPETGEQEIASWETVQPLLNKA